MAAKRKSLGKGLDALLSAGRSFSNADADQDPIEQTKIQPPTSASEAPLDASQGAAATSAEQDSDSHRGPYKEIPIELVERSPFQPRREFASDALEELAASIKQQGLMQPIIVRKQKGDRFELVAGERRWRAAQLAGCSTIASLVRDISDRDAMAMALIENIQREDLNPIEEAEALANLQNELHLTQQELADAVGKSRSTVANLLRLNGLDSEVRRQMASGHIEMGHGRALLGLDPANQRSLARTIIKKSLSVRQTEAAVRALAKPQQSQQEKSRADTASDPNIRSLELELAEKLGSSVAIQHTQKGSGRLVLKYSTLDELDGILAKLR